MIQSNMEEGSHDGGSGLYLWQQIGCGYLYSISSKKADGATGLYPTMLPQWPTSFIEDLLPKGLTTPNIIPQLGNKYWSVWTHGAISHPKPVSFLQSPLLQLRCLKHSYQAQGRRCDDSLECRDIENMAFALQISQSPERSCICLMVC